jgi:hypothetical protein
MARGLIEVVVDRTTLRLLAALRIVITRGLAVFGADTVLAALKT